MGTKRDTLRQWRGDLLVITLGSIAYALSVSVFSAPNDIAPGGFTGLATLIHYLWNRLPIGITTLALNVPLLIVTRCRMGRGFLVRTLLGLVISSVLTDVFTLFVPAFHGEKILTCFFGGALAGLGIGLILARGGTTGGTDTLARLLERRWPHIPIGQLLLIVDGCVVALSALIYRQLESPLYAIVFIVVSSLVTDRVVYGGRRGKMAMILTKEQPALTQRIMTELERGVTLLDSTGGYTGDAQKMILCAVSREEVVRLKRMTFELDPSAFFMMLSSDEVVGDGWLSPDKSS